MVRVKICGITRVEALHAACAADADALGFVFYAQSPRHLEIAQAAQLVAQLPPFVQSVGLFVDAAPEDIEAGLKAVPLEMDDMLTAETSPFVLRHQSSECRARCGELNTRHVTIKTPVFMPVGPRPRSRRCPPRSCSGWAPRSSSAIPITCSSVPAAS